MPVLTAMADPPLEPPGDREGSSRMSRWPPSGVLVGGPERELVEVGLAHQHRTGCAQVRDDGCIGMGTMTVPLAGPSGRREAFDVNQVFDCDRDAMKGPEMAARGELPIGLRRLPPGLVSRHGDERVQFFIFRVNPLETHSQGVPRHSARAPGVFGRSHQSKLCYARSPRPSFKDVVRSALLAAAVGGAELKEKEGARPGVDAPKVVGPWCRGGHCNQGQCADPATLKREAEPQLRNARLVCHVRSIRRLSERRIAL